jgi:AraC-like DNA-binding protein/mannose-6-phosphate isomerase-like protein (cupin superfamily)
MENEFEIIRYPKINNVNLFIVAMEYRTPHLHRDFEVDLVLEGQLTLLSNNERYTASAGDLLLLDPNRPHELFTHGEIGATILCLQISPRFFRDTMPAMSDVFFRTVKLETGETSKWLKALRKDFIELTAAYMDARPQRRLLCASRLNEMFYMLLEHVPHHFLSSAEQQAIERKVERILRLLDFVNANFTHKIKLQDFAQAEGVSLNYMSYFVKAHLNQTFQEYVATVRYHQARKLLLTENKRLIDICIESGFSDPRYLTKTFLRKTGSRPDAYKRKYALRQEEDQYHRSIYSSQKFYSDEEAARILEHLKICY